MKANEIIANNSELQKAIEEYFLKYRQPMTTLGEYGRLENKIIQELQKTIKQSREEKGRDAK